jgi:fibronectin-binding autotransporter adhesin
MNRVRQQEQCPRRVVLFVAAMIVLLLAGVTSAFAQCSDTWTGGDGNGAWSDGKNWSNGKEPGNTDTVCIQQSKAAVTLDVNDTIVGLTLGSSDSLTLPTVTNATPSLNISGASLANSGQITLAPPVSFGATSIGFTSTGTATLSGPGTITLNANSFGGDSIGGAGTLLNQSTIQGGGGFDMTFNNAKAGVINANQSGSQLVVGRNQNKGASANTGLMEATAGGQLVMGSLTLNNVGGVISASGTGSNVTFSNQGQGGQTITGGTFKTSSGGVIYSGNSTTLDGTNGNTIANTGTLSINSSVQGTINNTGTVEILSNSSGQAGANIPSSQTLTLSGSGSTVLGDGTNNSYNNQNFISGSGAFVNQQLVSGTGNIDNLGSLTNSGTINGNIPPGSANLQLVIGRTPTITNTGVIEATQGGQVLIGSTHLSGKGTLEASGKGSSINFVDLGQGGQIISGGTYKTAGGGVIYAVSGDTTIDGTTSAVNNKGALVIPNGASSNFQGTMNNTGTFKVLSTGSSTGLNIPGGETFTLAGSGSVIMGDGTNNTYNNQNYISGSGILANQQTISGAGGILNLGSFTNTGTINANTTQGANNIQLQLGRSGLSTNTGIIEATNAAALVIGSIDINNNGGTIQASGTNSGVFLVGSLGTSGLTISGGTFTTSGGGTIYDQGGSLLDGTTNPVVIDGNFMVPPGNGANMQGTIKNTSTIQVLTNNGNNTALSVPGGETLTLTGTGDLQMGDGTNNSYNNNINLGGSGILVNQSTVHGTGLIGNQQTITNQGIISANVPVGSANIALEVGREGTGGISNSGTMEAANGGELEIFPSTSFTNTGTLIAQVKSTVNINSRFTNLSNNTLTGGTYTVAGTLIIPGNIDINAAKITLNGVASQILNPNTNALAAFVTNAPKGAFILSAKQSFISAGTFTNQGAIAIGKGSVFTVGSGGSYLQTGGKTTVDGKLTLAKAEEENAASDSEINPAASVIRISKGSLFGNGGDIAAHVVSSGTVVPADSLTKVGELTVTGAYTQTAVGALDANIAGASSGQFDLLNVTGTATLGGTLNIGLLKNFVPAVGDTFAILVAKSVTGVFATVNGTKINDSEHFTVTYNSDNVTLTVVSGS